ncbi:ribosomal protein S6 kinase beta-1-like [Trichogramma pretiosum]|uniref:ribosomal protein S6 kinase beta-1-like n=1 Tax=Trichogramma pretiosum TaxID=7493 RepID=UPI0006C98261|nr:ribosomal protein S6 kinase beta-1-like [Trichogramma pretiosum]
MASSKYSAYDSLGEVYGHFYYGNIEGDDSDKDVDIGEVNPAVLSESNNYEEVELSARDLNPGNEKIGPQDFEFKKVLGEGGFGKVYQVQKITGKDKNKIFAMKVMSKPKILKNRKDIDHTKAERNILQSIKHPFIVDLHYAFQTQGKLFLILEYLGGGELFTVLGKNRIFLEHQASFFAAEIILALEYLHSNGIIYRDLKPENVLFDEYGHIKLTDFGLCKEKILNDAVTHTFCGTIEYMAPEILQDTGHGRACDWWSLGIILFEMLNGKPPFLGKHKNFTIELITKTGKVKFPKHITHNAQGIIRQLLKRDVSKRLGSGVADANEIKRHRFFEKLDWNKILSKQEEPPFVPKMSSSDDVRNFDKYFTQQYPIISPECSGLSESANRVFEGFTYVAPSILDNFMQNRSLQMAEADDLRNFFGSQIDTVESNLQDSHVPESQEAMENYQPLRNSNEPSHLTSRFMNFHLSDDQ